MKNNVQIPQELFVLLVKYFDIIPSVDTDHNEDAKKKIIEMLTIKQKKIENRNLYSIRYLTDDEKSKQIAIDLYNREKNSPV